MATLEAVFIGMVIAMAGTIPRNLFYAANLRFLPGIPWAVPVTGIYLWLFWRFLAGNGPPGGPSPDRAARLRANPLSGRAWAWSLVAGGIGIVALVIGLKLANRMVILPTQTVPDLSQVPRGTVLALLLMAAPVAGVIEESAFRGYMQGPIEKRSGLVVAILVTGTMFALAHLDFTLILWPYYVAVAALYGTVTYLTNSILPAIVLHTAGNLYSNFDLWLTGQAEWQAAASPGELIWATGADRSFWLETAIFVVVAVAMVAAFARLARVTRSTLVVAAAPS